MGFSPREERSTLLIFLGVLGACYINIRPIFFACIFDCVESISSLPFPARSTLEEIRSFLSREHRPTTRHYAPSTLCFVDEGELCIYSLSFRHLRLLSSLLYNSSWIFCSETKATASFLPSFLHETYLNSTTDRRHHHAKSIPYIRRGDPSGGNPQAPPIDPLDQRGRGRAQEADEWDWKGGELFPAGAVAACACSAEPC